MDKLLLTFLVGCCVAGCGTSDSGDPPGSRSDATEGDAGGAATDPYELGLDGTLPVVVVGEAYLACESDTDCTLVKTSCAECCEQVAIDADLVETFAAAFQNACADYQGAICDCNFLPLEARCVEQRCSAVIVEEER